MGDAALEGFGSLKDAYDEFVNEGQPAILAALGSIGLNALNLGGAILNGLGLDEVERFFKRSFREMGRWSWTWGDDVIRAIAFTVGVVRATFSGLLTWLGNLVWTGGDNVIRIISAPFKAVIWVIEGLITAVLTVISWLNNFTWDGSLIQTIISAPFKAVIWNIEAIITAVLKVISWLGNISFPGKDLSLIHI